MTVPMKHSFKRIEVPLSKFTNELIPHHVESIEKYKKDISKVLTARNRGSLNPELNNVKRRIRQLKDLMYELDTLRTQVKDNDLDKFDTITLSSRKTILTMISEYNRIQKQIEAIRTIEIENEATQAQTNSDPMHGAQQIQITEDIETLKLQQYENRLKNVENIQNDIEDIHDMYQNLGQMVNDQRTYVNDIDTNTETALTNVNEANKMLKYCSRMKTAAYPVTGAIIGTCLGGPIGFVAGLKFGGLAAIGLGVAGYTGGKFVKNYNEAESEQRPTTPTNIQTVNSDFDPEFVTTDNKKDT